MSVVLNKGSVFSCLEGAKWAQEITKGKNHRVKGNTEASDTEGKWDIG